MQRSSGGRSRKLVDLLAVVVSSPLDGVLSAVTLLRLLLKRFDDPVEASGASLPSLRLFWYGESDRDIINSFSIQEDVRVNVLDGYESQ